MLLSKTPISRDEVQKFADQKRGRLIGCEFAEEGDPKYGVAYWKYFVVKKDGKLYIIETFPVGDHLEHTLSIIV